MAELRLETKVGLTLGCERRGATSFRLPQNRGKFENHDVSKWVMERSLLAEHRNRFAASADSEVTW